MFICLSRRDVTCASSQAVSLNILKIFALFEPSFFFLLGPLGLSRKIVYAFFTFGCFAYDHGFVWQEN
ncbi:hypothetical protein BKA56DRAFT_601602, partial [Ilyonectria sp. MPI-CAGE-AT-0026]